jgi:hypothetical protein
MIGEAARLVCDGGRLNANHASPPQIAGDDDAELPRLRLRERGILARNVLLDATPSSAVPYMGAAF